MQSDFLITIIIDLYAHTKLSNTFLHEQEVIDGMWRRKAKPVF